MSGIFEQLLAAQVKTNELLEAILANGGAVAAGSTTETKETTTASKGGKKTTKKEDAPAKPKHTKDEVVAAVVAVKDAFGAPEAKKITAHFDLKKVAEAKEDQFDAIVEMCNAKLAEKQDEEEDEEI
ncbi:hypothetical protein [Providencia phage vB_PreS-PatoteraRojo]|nr:hypothetical protein [Providencia phage vB_PreS-PatoteraRojo]